MNDKQPRLSYEYEDPTDPNTRCRFHILGGNGEPVHKSEWYDTRSNAERGFEDLGQIMDQLRDVPIDPIAA
jgi:uncharacterized protein YegP (UPF0339 family)